MLHGEHAEKQETNKFIIPVSCSVHGYGYESDGVRVIQVNVSIMPNFTPDLKIKTETEGSSCLFK